MDRVGVRKAGNAGMVVTLAVGNGTLLHTLTPGRTCRITKIMAYNVLGIDVPLLFGTQDLTAPAALFVALLPPLVAINPLDNEWTEAEIPAVEWAADTQAAALGRTGDIYIVAGAVLLPLPGIVVSIEVEEYGA